MISPEDVPVILSFFAVPMMMLLISFSRTLVGLINSKVDVSC